MANEKINSLIKSAKKVTKKAANTTIELADMASLNLKLQGQSVKLSEKYEALGKLSYDKLANEADNADKIASLVEEIGKAIEEIENTKAEIKAKKKARKAKKVAEKQHCCKSEDDE